MKKFSILVVALVLIGVTGAAQVKKAAISATIQTPTINCADCKKRIEEDLKRVDGIQKVVADFKRRTVKVTFISDRTNLEYIKTAIANIGYDADDVKANPEAYARLPKTCKKPG
ncbi:MAG: heavy-metal-associated domain-containing protein [Chitinophagaceae bacterium]